MPPRKARCFVASQVIPGSRRARLICQQREHLCQVDGSGTGPPRKVTFRGVVDRAFLRHDRADLLQMHQCEF